MIVVVLNNVVSITGVVLNRTDPYDALAK